MADFVEHQAHDAARLDRRAAEVYLLLAPSTQELGGKHKSIEQCNVVEDEFDAIRHHDVAHNF